MAHTERVATVTGASRRIGRATTSRLAVSGFAVVVLGRIGNPQEIAEVVAFLVSPEAD